MMDTKCRLCGKHISEIKGAFLTRVNETGIPGVWECRPMCGADLPQETAFLLAVLGDDKEATE